MRTLDQTPRPTLLKWDAPATPTPTFEQLQAEILALKIDNAQITVAFSQSQSQMHQAQSQVFHFIAKEEAVKLQALQTEAKAFNEPATPVAPAQPLEQAQETAPAENTGE